MKRLIISGILLLLFNAANAQLPEQDQSALRYMRQEEKMAQDAYLTLHEKWQVRPFQNIIAAETQHMRLIKDLLIRYNVPDPLAGMETKRGAFENSTIQKMYTDLMVKGAVSLADALKVGALIEETDIADLQVRYDATSNDGIRNTFTLLRQASENHLRAFVRSLKRQGLDYTPQVLQQDEYNRIINSGKKHGQMRRGTL